MINIDSGYLRKLLSNLVRINSCNPSLTPGSPGEGEIGEFISGVMRDLGLTVNMHVLGPNRVNVVGILKGEGSGRSLMLNGHVDTVGVEGMKDPFSGDYRNGRIYGRGSQDMKGSVAAMIAAAKAVLDSGKQLAGDLIITAVADEEYASIGTADIVRNYTADAAIVTEPTDMRICRAHRGFIWYEIESLGKAAHGSRYEVGVDAIMRMGRFLAELDKLEQAVRQRPPHPLAGPPSLHASLINGGTEVSVYSANCQLQVERRTAPGEIADTVTAEFQEIIDRLQAADPSLQLRLNPFLERPPFEIDADADIVGVTDKILEKRIGKKQPHFGATFWTDAALLMEAGIDTILLGPIGDGLHSKEEWVDMDSVVDLAHVLAETALEFCGTTG